MTSPIAKLGHIAFVTPDLEESVWFFRDLIGLQEVEREDGTVYLNGLRDREHHTMSLTQGEEGEVDHIGWRTTSSEALRELAQELEENSMDVRWVDKDHERGIGEAIRFRTPTGHPYEFYYDVEKPSPPSEKRSKLKNRVYSPSVANRVAPRRIDHAHVQDPRADEHAEWMEKELGFKVREKFVKEDGTNWGWWMSVTALPHDIGIHMINDADDPKFHHISYHVDSLQDLWDAADILRENGIGADGGPGKHAITKADFLYVIDPASGIRIELFAGPGYLIFEPDWEPIEWREEEIGAAERTEDDDHQWIGTQFSQDSVGYSTRFP